MPFHGLHGVGNHQLGPGGQSLGETLASLRYQEVILNTQTIGAGQTVVYTNTPTLFNVTAIIPVGETVTISETGTLEITGR